MADKEQPFRLPNKQAGPVLGAAAPQQRTMFVGPLNPDPRLEGLLRMVLDNHAQVRVGTDSLLLSGPTGIIDIRVGPGGDLHIMYIPANDIEPGILLFAGCNGLVGTPQIGQPESDMVGKPMRAPRWPA